MNEALDALARGRVVAAATESFFGLLADATNDAAVTALFELKPRERDRGVPLLLPSREAWGDLVVGLPESARVLADAFWPGPLTIALSARPSVDTRLTAGGTVAARLPGESPAASLARRLGRPLTATSANLPGDPPALLSSDVRDAFWRSISAGTLRVLDGEAPGGQPSTVVVVDGEGLRVARAGAIDASAIDRVWRSGRKPG